MPDMMETLVYPLRELVQKQGRGYDFTIFENVSMILLRSLRGHLPQDSLADPGRADSGLALHQPDREKKSRRGLSSTNHL